ncbi:MAG: thioredoxin [Lachnospiraceae bacterium]|nr:thioredoxin [Lachnospiraceae bacterium]
MIYQLNDNNFEDEVIKSDKPVIVDFYADWCGPCKMMAPIVSQIADENMDRIKVCKLNIDENTSTAMKYRVLSIPTLVFFKGGKMLGRIEGAVPKSMVDQKTEKYFG